MWITFKKSYIGPLGSFPKDTKQDLPDKTARQFIKSKHAVKCLPPWEEKTNFAMQQFDNLKTNCSQISQELTGNELSMKKAQEAADSIPRYEKVIEYLQKKLDKAKKALEDFAAANKIPMPKETDGKQEEKTGRAETGSGPEDDDNTSG